MFDTKVIKEVIKNIETSYISMFKNVDFFAIDADTKNNLTSVTKYDIEATKFCINYIKKIFPNSNVWIEEDQNIIT